VIAVTPTQRTRGLRNPGATHPYLPLTPSPNIPKANMTISQTPSSIAERRLAIARRLYQALVAQDPDRAITLRDGGGGVVARHDPQRGETADYVVLTRHCGKTGV
jgi:hypothetical protein